jgi:maltooligosyltrehalose trehalohydrolase
MLKYIPQKIFGAQLANRGVHFRLWAPNQDHVSVVVDDSDPMSMSRSNDGWHELMVPTAKVGTRYKYRLQDGLQVPDPASRFQPDDVHGPSEVIDPHSYQWGDGEWTGRPWEECVIYELHIGDFTQEGTFRSAIDRLDYLADLGVTAIEIMPLADFPGSRNWGYDRAYPCHYPAAERRRGEFGDRESGNAPALL